MEVREYDSLLWKLLGFNHAIVLFFITIAVSQDKSTKIVRPDEKYLTENYLYVSGTKKSIKLILGISV